MSKCDHKLLTQLFSAHRDKSFMASAVAIQQGSGGRAKLREESSSWSNQRKAACGSADNSEDKAGPTAGKEKGQKHF